MQSMFQLYRKSRQLVLRALATVEYEIDEISQEQIPYMLIQRGPEHGCYIATLCVWSPKAFGPTDKNTVIDAFLTI